VEDIFKRVNSIKNITNSSLSGILSKVNINFETLSNSFDDYLTLINFNQTANSISIKELTVDTIHLNKLLHIDLFGDNDLSNDLRIDDQGRIYAKSFIGELSEVERLRLKSLAPSQLYLETGLPVAGVPGDIIFTGVDFFGYMGESFGWKSLTFGESEFSDLFAGVGANDIEYDNLITGSPGIGTNIQDALDSLYLLIQALGGSGGGSVGTPGSNNNIAVWQNNSLVGSLWNVNPTGELYPTSTYNIGTSTNKIGKILLSNTSLAITPEEGTLEYDGNSVFFTVSSTRYDLLSAGTAQIGQAEDTDYTDGLFTDFVPTTPVGTAVDRFNEILKSLVPPPAPILSNYDGTKSGTHVNGKLSFDSSNPITAQSYFGGDLSTSPILVDGTWSILDHPTSQIAERFGICSLASGNITGDLNYQVIAHTATPTPSYAAKMFSDADKGYLKLYINGTEKVSATIDLTILSATDSTSSGASSGINISVATPSYFAQGDPFVFFYNRTGTYLVRMDDSLIRQGYNYIYIQHIDGTNFNRILGNLEFILDDDATSTSYSGNSLHTLSMTGSKKISGIDYHTGGTAQYNVNIDNAYRNTYSQDSDAISFTGNSNTYGVLLSASSQALGNCSGNEALQVSIVNKVATLTSSGRRILNNLISVTTNVKRTIQGNTSGGASSINNILLDNVSASSTAYVEGFDDETYRLKSGISYNLVSDITSNPWDSTQSLSDGSSGHTDGLQVIDSRLLYSGTNGYVSDFRTTNIINGSVFNDGGTGGSARNYTGLAGSRTFIRYFRQVSPTTSNFTMTINGATGTFVPTTTSLTGNNIHVEIKLPTQSGWFDAYDDFVTGQFNDGDGCRNATLGAGRAFGTTWGLTSGTLSTANTSGYIVIRITVGNSFAGYFSGITFNYV